ncbi:MAG: hypothetical protein NVS2B6_06340 [Thermoleophilaceae bacterium]
MTPPTAISIEPQWGELDDLPVLAHDPSLDRLRTSEGATVNLREDRGESPIFAADDGRRARRTGAAGRLVAALCAAWMAAAILGSTGSGDLPKLPGVSLGSARAVSPAPQRGTLTDGSGRNLHRAGQRI